ncbi:MAG: hypothetical protein ACOCUS_03240, partial [Polyangiales bacterium]
MAEQEQLPPVRYDAELDLSGAPAPLAIEAPLLEGPATPTGTGKNPTIVRAVEGLGRAAPSEREQPSATDVYRTFQQPVWDQGQHNLRRLLTALPPADIIADPVLEPERFRAAVQYRVDWSVAVARTIGRMRLALNWLTHHALDAPALERFAERWAEPAKDTALEHAQSWIVPWDAGALARREDLFEWRIVPGIGPGLESGIPREAGFEGNSPPGLYARGDSHVPAAWREFFRMFWGSGLAKPDADGRQLVGGAVTLSYLEHLAARYAVTPFTDAIAICWSAWMELNFGELYAERLREYVETMQPGRGHEPVYFPPQTWASFQETPGRVPKSDAQRSALESRRASAISAIQGVFGELRRSAAPGELEAAIDELADEQGAASASLDEQIARAREWLRTLQDAADVSADAAGAIEAAIGDAEASVRAGAVEEGFARVAAVLGQLDSLADTVATIGDEAAGFVSAEIKALVADGINELASHIAEQVASQVIQTAITAIGTTVANVLGAAVGAAIGKIVAAIITDPGSFFTGGITIKQDEYLDTYGLAITSPLLRWVTVADMRADLVRLRTGRALDEMLRMLSHVTQVTGADLGLSPTVSPILSQEPPPAIPVTTTVYEPAEESTMPDTYPADAAQLYDFAADLYRVYIPADGTEVHKLDRQPAQVSPEAMTRPVAHVALSGTRPNPLPFELMPPIYLFPGLGQIDADDPRTVELALTGAGDLADRLAREVRDRGYDYDRDLAREFQEVAGLSPDGLYGPATRDAIEFFGSVSAPAPLFRGGDEEFVPPDERGETPPPEEPPPEEPARDERREEVPPAPEIDGWHHVGDEKEDPGLPAVEFDGVPADEAAGEGREPSPPPSPDADPGEPPPRRE